MKKNLSSFQKKKKIINYTRKFLLFFVDVSSISKYLFIYSVC